MNKIQFVINSIQINGTNFILNILCVYFCWEDGKQFIHKFCKFLQILQKSLLVWAYVVTKKPLRLIVHMSHMPHVLCFQMNKMF